MEVRDALACLACLLIYHHLSILIYSYFSSSPHPSSCELIASASSQKLLIWNLRLAGYSSIQHILHGHFRAVTDINWHPQYENIVGSSHFNNVENY